MNRYFYYILFVEFIGSIISVIPTFLFESSNEGAIWSMLLALFAGGAFIYFTTKFFNQFPGIAFPELLQQHMSNWFASLLLTIFSIVWFVFGLKTLMNYAFLLKRFLMPYFQLQGIVIMLLLFISFSFFMHTKKLLYTLEIVLFINIPLMIYIIGVMYGNKGLDWDYVMKSMMYFHHSPNLLAFSSSLLIFFGAANLIIFNREFKKRQKLSPLELILISLVAAWILFTGYFIPIGYNGFDRIEYVNFPWLLGTDSLKVALAFLERIMFVFLFLHISVTFVSIIIVWHVSMELLNSAAAFIRGKQKKNNVTTYLFMVIVWSISLIVSMFISESDYLIYTKYLFISLPPFLLFFLMICWFISWRDKHGGKLKAG